MNTNDQADDKMEALQESFERNYRDAFVEPYDEDITDGSTYESRNSN